MKTKIASVFLLAALTIGLTGCPGVNFGDPFLVVGAGVPIS